MAGDKVRRYQEGLRVQAVSTELNSRGPTQAGAGISHAATVDSQIVFIDGSVPDAQVLAAGVAPGVVAVLLDPNQAGVQQIADYLTSHDVHDVAAIDIVAHGADGMIRLGSTLLSAATIADYQTQLAQIGDALRPGGAIQLYGCDVAQDAGGGAFLQQLSRATGGANIAAASHDVGAAAEGGAWNLDVDVGTVDGAGPFTTTALAAYPDLLSAPANQLFFNIENAETGTTFAAGNRIEHIGVSGATFIAGSAVDVADETQSNDSNGLIGATTGIAVDTALNEYFVGNDQESTGSSSLTIQKGNITGGGLTTFFTLPSSIKSLADPFNPTDNGILGELAVNPQSGELYYGLTVQDHITGNVVASETGIYEVPVTGGTPIIVSSTIAGLQSPFGLALDPSANLLFFTDGEPTVSGFPIANDLDTMNLNTGSVTVLHTFTTQSNNDPNFQVQGLAVNPDTGMLYVATANFADNTSTDNAILSIPFTTSGSGNSATASIGTIGTLYSGSGAFKPSDVVVDPTNGVLYTSGQVLDGAEGTGVWHGAVFAGTITGKTPLTAIESTVSIAGAAAANDAAIPQLVLLRQPIVTASGTVIADSGGSAVTVDSGATVAEPDNQLIASAIITGALAGDTLDYNRGIPNVFADGHTITGNFSGGTLALSGVASAADYQSAFDAVSFATTGTIATPRSIGWTVNDGVVLSATPVSTVDVHVPPAIIAGATATFTGGGTAVALDSGLTITDASSATLAGATIEVAGFISGDSLHVGTAGGLASSFSNGTLTLSGTANVATYQTALDSISYDFTPGGDPTDGGSHTSRTIDWTVNDGTLASTPATSALNVVHAAPTIVASGTVTFNEGGSPVVLDSTATAADPDSGGNLTSATVTVGSFISGDTLTVGAADGLSTSFSGGTLTLTGTASLATYNAALDSVDYGFTAGGDPTAGGTDTSRTISWMVSDGVADSGIATSSVATLCFCAGTRIATPDGEVPVEQLAVGDRVLTLDGRAEPIRWIGAGQSLLAPGRRSESTPVIVRAHALDYGVPARDLRITKGHSLYLEGVLIPVENLINYRTIVWDDEARSVVVYHLELDTHEVLLADGAAAESYRDDGNRRQFQNINPGWNTGEVPEPFAPVVTNGPLVAAVWRRLLLRAEPCAPIPLTGDPDIHLLVDGTRVAPCDVVDGCHVFEAVAGSDVRIASRCAVPAELGENHDQRRLGVAVRRIVLYRCGQRLEVDAGSPMLAEGFHGYEAADRFRWTDGAGLLPASLLGEFVAGEPIGIEVQVGCMTR